MSYKDKMIYCHYLAISIVLFIFLWLDIFTLGTVAFIGMLLIPLILIYGELIEFNRIMKKWLQL